MPATADHAAESSPHHGALRAHDSGNHGAALLVVDVQNDFCAGGTLAVPRAELALIGLNRRLDDAVAKGLIVYASRHWHPPASHHFRAHGGAWPAHCVQDTDGARFPPDLHLPASAVVITKGEAVAADGYSAFEGRTSDGRPFLGDLHERGISHLYVGGLATDHCVKHTVLDALSAGLEVTLLRDAIAGVDPDESAQAIVEMQRRGARLESDGSWEHFGHGSDIGVRGVGPTKAAAFEQAACALTGVVVDPLVVRSARAASIACDAPSDDLLLVDWLNALVYEMATRRMVFSAFAVTIEGSRLRATAWGEAIDPVRHEPAVEVKGATYTAARVEHLPNGQWLAQCVVDV